MIAVSKVGGVKSTNKSFPIRSASSIVVSLVDFSLSLCAVVKLMMDCEIGRSKPDLKFVMMLVEL